MLDFLRSKNKLPEIGSMKSRPPKSVAPETVTKPPTPVKETEQDE